MIKHPFGQFQYPTSPEAVFDEDAVRHYQDFLARRRGMRPSEEYRPATQGGCHFKCVKIVSDD